MTSINNYILPLFVSLFFVINLQAQVQKRDSLKIQLENHKANDTTRANILYDLAYAHFQGDMKLTNLYLKEAEDLSNALNYEKGKARVFYLKGILENIKSNYNESLNFFKESLRYYESIQNKKGIADVYIAFGITNCDLSQYDEALENYKKALEIYKESGNKREIATCLINTGNIYSEIGRYNEAITNYKEALILSEILNDEDGISFVHINLGVVYRVQGNYPLAIENYNKSLAYDEKMGDTLGMAKVLDNLGDTYTAIKKYDKALEYHKKSFVFLSKIGNKKLIAANNSNIGNIYLKKKEFTKALEYFGMSLKASQEVNDLKLSSLSYINIGNIYLLQNKTSAARKNYINAKEISEETNNRRILSASLLGIAETYLHEKKYQKALLHTQKGQKIAEELELLENRKKATKILSEIYKSTGDYKKAFTNFQQYKMLNDSIFNKENIEKITQLEYEYKYKQALDSASIRELKLTKTVLDTSQNLKRSQRNLLLGVIGFLVTTLMLGAIIFFLKLRNEKSKTQNVVIEQKLLRSQMTPHFIFNSLSVLQGMILNREEKKSVSYLSKFSKLLRTILENSRDRTVLLSQELVAVENYLALQNLENELYTYTIAVEETMDTSRFKIPPMLIQPFVENAIEHAFAGLTGNRVINIDISCSNEELNCIITDNGVGIDCLTEGKNRDKKSLSTTITSERLQILSKDFKKKGAVTVEDRKKYNEQGTIVTLTIPYITIQNSEDINN
ncbi:tetratricopeptide repeat protein [Zhouia spongiae]|uniref:Tetratricopeptide repeat protein n=1 Tax=Zhouia spongiae TaxID=2202721 RepID=A0ABY3YL91_9FLAO|nr:tetratricopeptide repeat protein [Zhouia spongiae]UNY98610.1 tetratricopeptide repeat protein [Zhouia spongiae]